MRTFSPKLLFDVFLVAETGPALVELRIDHEVVICLPAGLAWHKNHQRGVESNGIWKAEIRSKSGEQLALDVLT